MGQMSVTHGVILAGGAGRRIGGDKATRRLAGRPLWTHVAGRLTGQLGTLAANGVTLGDLPVVADIHPALGPLSGIHASMVWAAGQGASYVLTVAVDTPFLPHDLAKRLAAAGGDIAVAQATDGLQGTTALWRTDLAEPLSAALTGGQRKVTDFANGHDLRPVLFADATPPPFFNINTVDDLAQAEAWLT